MKSDIRFVTIDGISLGYQIYGEASGAPPAIFVHGYSGRSTGEDGYTQLLDDLAAEFTVYALDLRGHGASVRETENWSMSAVADDVAKVVKALALARPLYIGHSFGGFTGLDCEARHPGTFSAICLLNTASAEGGIHTPLEAGRLLIEHGHDVDFLEQAYGSRSHAEAAALMDRRVHELYFAEYPGRTIIDAIKGISIPVLALNGAQDTVVPLFTQHATAMALAHCKEIVLTTAGHMMPLLQPTYTAREIIAFHRDDVAGTFPEASRRLDP